jgi:dockerin type I repeat protein
MSKGLVLSCFFLLCVVAVSGETPQHKRLPREKLEKYGDPPALLSRTGLSPRMVSQFESFTSYQVNVSASGLNITGDAANEPSICVDPTNGSKMAIGWRQFNSVTSNFRQAGWGYTSNGGMSWTFPGVLENNVFRSDPVLGSNDAGNFFYLSLLQTFFDSIWRSLDGGQSWMNIGPARGGDKQWFTVDNTNSTGHGFQYQFWSTEGNNYNGRQFTRSTDGGVTWLNPINIPNSPAWGTLDVDTNGNLFVVGVNFNTGQVWCERSTNAKNGAVTPTFDQSTAVDLGGDIDLNEPINPVGLVGQMFLAVDRSGASTNNNVYILASVLPSGFSSGSDAMFVRSTNGGQTFSAPHRINDDPINHNKWHWMGALAVAPNGRIDVVWLDTRNAANNTDSQLFYSYSLDGGNTWAPNVQVSNSFNPSLGYPNQDKMGDYMTIVSGNAGGNVAYCATFNGEEDIYYVRVAPSAPVVLSAVSRKTHGGAGTFDVPLPLTGSAGIECRSGSGPNSDGHQVIVTFGNPVTDNGVTVSSVDGLATVAQSVSGGVVTVDLFNVKDAQTIMVTLKNVNDGVHLGDVTVPMAVLLGDTTANGGVSASDVSQVKLQSGQTVNGSTFRTDVNANGSINATDAGIVKLKSGTSLP